MAQKNKTVLKTYFETGKKPTQEQFWDLIDNLAAERPFKTYVALLNQIGMAHPTAKVLENNTGEDFFWIRESTGVYKVLLPSNIAIDNVFISINNQLKDNTIKSIATMVISSESGNYLYIKNISDNLLYNTSVEIRFYNTSLIETTVVDSALARYWLYFKKNELKRDSNLLLPPFKFYNSYSGAKGEANGINRPEIINIWKKMTDEYIILPEIYDGKKNPHAFNLRTKQFCCAYSYTHSLSSFNTNYLNDCVKQARRTGATECIVDLGNDINLTNYNKNYFKTILIKYRADRGISRITLITNGVVNHHTISDLIV